MSTASNKRQHIEWHKIIPKLPSEHHVSSLASRLHQHRHRHRSWSPERLIVAKKRWAITKKNRETVKKHEIWHNTFENRNKTFGYSKSNAHCVVGYQVLAFTFGAQWLRLEGIRREKPQVRLAALKNAEIDARSECHRAFFVHPPCSLIIELLLLGPRKERLCDRKTFKSDLLTDDK